MTLIDGKATSEYIQKEELIPACREFQLRYDRAIGLAVIVVGGRKDSATYVRMKQRTSEAVGIRSWKLQIDLPNVIDNGDSSSHKEAEQHVVSQVYKTIAELNARVDVDGIIVQLPLPSFCDVDKILATIDPSKDVDGLHPHNHAALFQYATKKDLDNPINFCVPCTPAGCIELLDHYNIPIEGKHVVVLGRSQIVGLPVALLALHRNATVTLCHSKTVDLAARVREADIVISAIGRQKIVQKEMIKPGAVVIDVGINAVEDKTKKAGYRLVGDVDYDNVRAVASALTPVPGGVGPMTVVMLLRNTINCAYRRMSTETN